MGHLRVWGALVVTVACSIDESGEQGDASPDVIGGQDVSVDALSDVHVGDAGSDSPILPEGCDSGLADASCLGMPIPTGWQAIAIEVDASVTCPGQAGDFAQVEAVTNPQVNSTTCYCSPCSPSGSWSCSYSLQAGSNCGTGDDTTTMMASGCWTPPMPRGSFGGSFTQSGSPSCSGGVQQGTQDASATVVSACAPQKCSADFCGLAAAGYKLCIANATNGSGSCPTGFPNGYVLGTGVTTACAACPACTLTNATATCSGLLTGYGSNNCTGGTDGTQTLSTTDSCNTNPPGNAGSIYLEAGVPEPKCSPSGPPGAGDASVSGAFTVCCP